ncbi:MAG: peptidylprolyl isomerase [Bacteroidetes bacterium]|nr:peptidylprolyl isomerase [Bacteroidota bacterium]
MIRQLFASAFLLTLAITALSGQNGDPTLFTVQQVPVRVSEFNYIYSKNNQDKADYSEQSLRDYLDLYIKFKLKVQKARDMRLDTLSSLRSELEGYRRQLAKSYLEDKEVTDKLVRETFERMQQDVDISHIFFSADRNAKAADTLRAYIRAQNTYKLLQKGGSFEQVAADSSDDKTAKENKGNLGFITAMLPDGYYALEKAVYSSKVGNIAGPIRSSAGYHIVRINGYRPARGEMEVSQILLRKGDNPAKNTAIKQKVDSIYTALKTGAKWDELCAKFSDDKTNAAKGGYIGFFGINRYQKSFEDAAFALQQDGDFSAPVETSIGWHIIKRMSHRPVGNFETIKRPLTDRVKRDSRSEIARQSMIARIKKESSFQEYPDALANWAAKQVDSVFHTFKWKPDPAKPQDVLMRFGQTKTLTVADFEDYCARSGRDRMRGAGLPLQETIQKMYKAWSDEASLGFEESQLDKKYPEFRALMREYEDGILLFEALKINVWDRANTDSIGLEQYFKANLSQKYKWDERAQVSIYTLKTDDPEVLKKVRELAAKKNAAAVLKKINKKGEILTVLEKNYEKGKNKDLNNVWTAGSMTEAKVDAGTKTASFIKVESIMPPTAKTLSEARGYAVADYQDYLEKKWVEDLVKAYPVNVDENVLKNMIKKK